MDLDEDEFMARRERLLVDYEEWARSAAPSVEPGWADTALDWKFHYGDGDLTTWTTADLEEFALGWCPRKLSIPAGDAEPFLTSVGTFFLFLAARGLLGSRSSGPQQLLSWCQRHVRRFAREMADPANFGMAKSLFAGVGGLEGEARDADDVAALMEQVQGLSPEEVGAILAGSGEAPRVGPVRMPSDDERAASAAAAPVLVQLRSLHGYCAAPGRTLTQKGNLRVADARELVGLLETGDLANSPPERSVRSAEDLPVLSWLVEVALKARVVRRNKGRLVAVAAWERLEAVESLDRIVDAALDVGLGGPRYDIGAFGQVSSLVDGGWRQVLFGLLDAETAGVPVEIDEAVEDVLEIAGNALRGGHHLLQMLGEGRVRRQFERLEQLGVLTQEGVEIETDDIGLPEPTGGQARLTPAGIAVTARLLEEDGVVVSTRSDPATADAEEIVALAEQIAPEAWVEDATAWAAARGERAAAELGEALADGGREALTVLAVAVHLETVLGDRAEVAVRQMLGGRWDGVAVNWLAERGDTELVDRDPQRGLAGIADVLGVLLDTEGPEAVVAGIDHGEPPHAVIETLDRLWRLEHVRTGELLEVVGRHHPDKAVAKHARKVLAKHRSRAGSRG
ncbi:hypothetical protein C8D89_11954 [Actinomycetospora cinnamomea]|uniref:Uncharacterized protein n=1 Tax=Actinomycetospora cinnamomea TaxID=663609 RepID=A0A2U1EVJ2_9PSEU|nr:hypothetical protein C8D89_11954 [Actinomycetospora cinnamomea]